MTNIIVKCDIDTAKCYTGKRVYAMVDDKKYLVYFRVIADDFNINEVIDLAIRDKNILAIKYVGSQGMLDTVNPRGTYIYYEAEVGHDLDEDDIARYSTALNDGINVLIKLPIDYNKIDFVYDMSKKYINVRFCGDLFLFEGCNFGCCGKDICDKSGIKYDKKHYLGTNRCCCALPIYDTCDVELICSDTPSKGTKSNKSTKPAKSSKADLFRSRMFADGGVEF